MCVCWLYKKTSALQGQKFQVRHGWKIVIRVPALHVKTGKVCYLIAKETATVNTITTTHLQFLFNQSSLFFCRSLQVRPCSSKVERGTFSHCQCKFIFANQTTSLLSNQQCWEQKPKKQQQKLNRKVRELKNPDKTRFPLHHVHCCMVRGRDMLRMLQYSITRRVSVVVFHQNGWMKKDQTTNYELDCVKLQKQKQANVERIG